ncbi:MAG TPA: hypothetical protein VJQ59_16910 [Candidatus Sulfotelmatobacter sp.]|nr:hypothetical protein [Candidatus Sulfotelmatobacter sp.]
MSQHENHPVHEYSLETYRNEAPRLGKRCALVFGVYVDRRLPMSDRQVKNALHFSDMNSVRPRINDMIKMGLLEQKGSVIDPETKQRVRTVGLRLVAQEKQQKLF